MIARVKGICGWKACCAVLIVAAIAGIGCSLGGDDANAQVRKRIETLNVSADAFLLLTDDGPTVEVRDGATVYTMISAGSLNLGQSQNFALEANDVVIERPASGTVTLIRSQ